MPWNTTAQTESAAPYSGLTSMGFYSNLTTAVVGLLALVNAQVGETGVDNSTTPTTTQGVVTIHTVAVGKATNQFQPNSINADPGDIVSFQFYPKNHSVIRAEYGYPCVPYEDLHPGSLGFFSGFHPVVQVVDTVSIKSVRMSFRHYD